MAFKLRSGAYGLPQPGDTIYVYATGTTTAISGLKTADSAAGALANPITVPAAGVSYGFEPPSSARVDVWWVNGSRYLIEDVNLRDAYFDLGKKIASGAQALGTTAIANGACASLITIPAAEVLTTDVVDIGYNSTPIGKTGYDPAAAELSVRAFPTVDNINILVCNTTGSAVTPDAMTINWRVIR